MPLQLTSPEERFQFHRDHYYNNNMSVHIMEGTHFEDTSEMRNSVYP